MYIYNGNNIVNPNQSVLEGVPENPNDPVDVSEDDIEIWKPAKLCTTDNTYIMVSSFGNVKTENGRYLLLSKNGTYSIKSKPVKATKIIAYAFEIENYEKLESRSFYYIEHLDGNKLNNNVKNLKVLPRKGNVKRSI